MSPEYFTEIESHFAMRRGTPFILNAKDWALMKSWSDEGIPLPVVIEAIDSVFDKNEEKGNKKTINALSYCKHAVKELWQERKELQIGAEGVTPEEDVEPLLETQPFNRVNRVTEHQRAAGADDRAELDRIGQKPCGRAGQS